MPGIGYFWMDDSFLWIKCQIGDSAFRDLVINQLCV